MEREVGRIGWRMKSIGRQNDELEGHNGVRKVQSRCVITILKIESHRSCTLNEKMMSLGCCYCCCALSSLVPYWRARARADERGRRWPSLLRRDC